MIPTTPGYDVVVVGGGPAGLSAALVLGRSRRRVLVVDEGDPRNALAGQVHGFLTRDGTAPGELLRLGAEEVRRYGGELRSGTVDRLLPRPATPGEPMVDLALGDGGRLTARRVLVATGLRDELPAVDGLAERWGRDVLHCPYCHGWEVRDRAVGVLATRTEEVAKALTMTQWSGRVTLLLHGLDPEDLPADVRGRLTALRVPVVAGPVDGLVVQDDVLTGVRTPGGVVPVDALVVETVVVARDALLRAAGAEVVEGPFGHVVVADATGATGVPGVWVAGNVSDPASQVVVAAAAGYRAAVAIDHDLIQEDVDVAVRRARPDDAR